MALSRSSLKSFMQNPIVLKHTSHLNHARIKAKYNTGEVSRYRRETDCPRRD
jgi:hypothetical protein